MRDAAEPESRGYRDPGLALRWLVVMLAFEGLAAVAGGAAMVAFLRSVGAGPNTPSSLAQWLVAAQGAQVAAWACSGAAFVFWVRRCVLNARALGVRSLQRGPWSGVWMLVPIAWWWMPFLVASDLWHAADTRAAAHRHMQRAERRAARGAVTRGSTPPLVAAWWFTFVGGNAWACFGPAVPGLVPGPGIVLLLPKLLRLAALFLQARVAWSISTLQGEQRRRGDARWDEAAPRRAG